MLTNTAVATTPTNTTNTTAHQNNVNPATNTTTTTLDLPQLAPYLGPFAAACHRYPAPNDLAEAHRTHNIYTSLFHNPQSPLQTQPLFSMHNCPCCPC